jgi:peptidoglycan-associated lipoprotein
MRPFILCSRIIGCVASASLVLGIAACGGEKQVQARAPATVPLEPVGTTNLQPALLPDTPTASTVVIELQILRACDIPDADAYFQFDSTALTSFDRSALDALSACFTMGPMAGRTLRLVGHADPRGTPEYNMALGQARADAVSGYLTAHGLQYKQVTTTSRGAMDATGSDETGWAHDRRVDVYLGE